MNTKKQLIVIGGPTAVGKTSISIQLAKHLKTEIISADSRQFYKELSIGVSKPSEVELKEVKHHFIGHVSINKSYSVGQFEKDALTTIKQLFKKNNTLILCGGSGLYIDAVCEGLNDFPKVDQKIKKEINEKYLNKGLIHLQEELKKNDIDSYNKIDINNPHRIIRVLSVFMASGTPYSHFIKTDKIHRRFQKTYVSLHKKREKLYTTINQRVDLMINNGLIEEAKSLYKFRNKPSLQTIGYQEIFNHFDGKIKIDDAINQIKQNSRRYAKRQMTWFRKKKYLQIEVDNAEEINQLFKHSCDNNLLNLK